MTDVTMLLNAVAQGKSGAQDDLWKVVYDELKTLANQKMARERPGQTLSATGLVHEAYIKLGMGTQAQPFQNRRHFYGAAAEAMRRILIDRFRGAKSPKGGGELIEMAPGKTVSQENILAVHEALDQLNAIEPEVAELVKLHFFAGHSLMECSEIMEISDRTARRHWTFARTWLFSKLGGKDKAGKATETSAGSQ